MKDPALVSEEERLDALAECGILDTELPKVDAIVAKCFERDRSLRYAGVRELAADLRELV